KREELALLRVPVVEDENAAHAVRRCHLARRHALIHELVELLGVPALERGDPYPHGATSLVDASRDEPKAPSLPAHDQDSSSWRSADDAVRRTLRRTHTATRRSSTAAHWNHK